MNKETSDIGAAAPAEIVAEGNATFPGLSVVGIARMRMNFAIHHLAAAARLSREVGRFEVEHRDQPFGPHFDDVLGAAMGCVLLATASAESYANELFADREEHFSPRDAGILDLLWTEYERKTVIEKFELALQLRSGKKLNRGTSSVQRLDTLVKLRNAIVHFKPEWLGEPGEHQRLSKKLESHFSPSPWMKGEQYFPAAWASHDCTRWCVNTVRHFVDEFSTSSGLANRYEMFQQRFHG